MKYIFFLLVFISTNVYAQECTSLIASDRSLEDKVQDIAQLQNSWDCLEQLYRSMTHNPLDSNTLAISTHQGSMESVTNSEILNRISHITHAYMSFLSTKTLDLNIPSFYPPEYNISILNPQYFHTVESVENISFPVLNGFPSNIKNLFNRFIAQSHFFLKDYVSDSYVLKNKNIQNLSQNVPTQTFNSRVFIFELPSFVLCKKQENQHPQTSFHQYALNTYNELVQYINDHGADIATLYTSVFNIYRVSHEKEPQLFLNLHDILRSLPYGFEWNDELKSSLPSDSNTDHLQKIEEFIHLLKLSTFSQIILMAYSSCHSNQFNETLTVTYFKPLDDMNPSSAESSNDSQNSTPFFEIHYTMKESSYFDEINPSMHISYSTSLFQKDYFQNDMLAHHCQNCYEQLESFLHYISQESEK